jgi:hypothetical protein
MASLALPRFARPLVAAIAGALLLAAATGSAGAAPSASSSAASPACVKATKALRTAKSRLKKAQARAKRGQASRATLTKVAEARRAVKKAQLAKKRACAPAKPGGTPSTPGGTPSTPGGTPSGSPPPPPGGSENPPPPPARPPSDELIQKALDEGRIDADTALRYRVFAEFGDSRLPDEFRGSPSAATDTPVLDDVRTSWDQLSPATREALDPFFIPPFNPGSWYEPGSPAGLRALAKTDAAAAPGVGEPGSNLCTNTAPNMNRWGYVTAVGGKVRVWYENTRAGQLDKAISVAQYLDSGVWGKVISVFREPLTDGGDLTGQRCRGFDPAIDYVLSAFAGASGRTIAYYDKGGCKGPAAGFVLVNRDLTGKELTSTVAHELAHLGQAAFAEDHCRPAMKWLSEATATWVENHVGGLGPDHPEKWAPYFFDHPDLSLEANEQATGLLRHYGSYLFFQWLAKHKSSEAITKIWEKTEAGGHPIDAIQAALQELGYAGGFQEAWKQFALAGLNPLPQVDWFKQWGQPRGARISHDPMAGQGDKTFPVSLPHLSADYHWLNFTSGVKTVQVTNELAGVAGASVQLWLKIDDGGQVRYEVRDVSGEETTTFCRDLPPENVQEMAIVIADSTSADRAHRLEGNVQVKTRPTCSKWDGTTKTTITQDGLTEVYLANYSFDPQWTGPLDGGGIESYFMAQGSYDMHASWSISGVSETDGCTYSGGTNWPAGVVGLQATLDLKDFGKGNPATTYEFGYGLPFKSIMVQRVCPDGYTGPVYRQLGIGFMSQPHPFDPTDQSIIGSETQDYGGVVIKRDWDLSRNGIAP